MPHLQYFSDLEKKRLITRTYFDFNQVGRYGHEAICESFKIMPIKLSGFVYRKLKFLADLMCTF
jgi:hypothetical protein